MVIKRVKTTSNRTLKQHPLEDNSLTIIAFFDSSFDSNMDLSTQLGYIIIFPTILGILKCYILQATNTRE